LLYRELAERFKVIEDLSRRLEMTDELISLFRSAGADEIGDVIRLTTGDIAPPYEGIDLGVAEKLALKALNLVTSLPDAEVEEVHGELGDIGLTAQTLLAKKRQVSLFSEPLTTERVMANLNRIARVQGRSSQDLKLKLIAELLHDAVPLEGRYLARTICRKMRLGVSDLTLIDALSYAYDERLDSISLRLRTPLPPELAAHANTLSMRRTAPLYALIEALGKPNKNGLEKADAEADLAILQEVRMRIQEGRGRIVKAYNIHPDLPYIASLMAKGGMDTLDTVKVTPGIPLMSMLGERLHSLQDILNKMGGECAFEYKYDGLRIQAHLTRFGGGFRARLFSRQLEDVTDQYPDVKAALERNARTECIVEGECVPIDPQTGDLLPFQVISQRRGRKYELERMQSEIPVSLVLFDCMNEAGSDITSIPYLKRRDALASLFPGLVEGISKDVPISLSVMKVLKDWVSADGFFQEALSAGCEGVMAKSVGEGSVYQAGNRGWLWIKYKRDYDSELADTFDLAIVGAFRGTGRRAGHMGAFLAAAYDPQNDRFKTLCKIGSGFKDGDLETMDAFVARYTRKDGRPDPRLDARIVPDVYLEPGLVLEILGSELSFSPVHTCGMDVLREGAGLALRFPRFTGRIRDDKSPEQCTTIGEIIAMYKDQVKLMRT
jgi:DNA ligase-1